MDTIGAVVGCKVVCFVAPANNTNHSSKLIEAVKNSANSRANLGIWCFEP